MSAEEVYDFIAEDVEFYEISSGGVTFSGGEPLLQADFVATVSKRCAENGISVCVDTAASVPFSEFEKVLPYTDQFLIDLKSPDAALLKRLTGANSELVLENIRRITERNKSVTIRIPVIPGHNDSVESMNAYAALIKGRQVELLPFHRLGSSKYEALNQSYAYAENIPPSKEKMAELKKILSEKGVEVL